MWDLPGPGIEPVTPALAGGFLTTAPPGKSFPTFLNQQSLGICVAQKSNFLNKEELKGKTYH